MKADGGKKRAALDLLASLPLSAWLETSFTSLKSPVPGTQNGSVEMPQDISLFLSGAWTTHVGSFMQVTYDVQDDHFGIDNTDVRYANKTKLGGKELVFGLNVNNNPTVEDLWNSTPAWGYPFVADDWAPTPTAAPIVASLGQDVAGFGGYAMWNNHLYLDATLYRSQHIGAEQPNSGTDFGLNIRGVAPYWRVAWQQLTGKTQYRVWYLRHAHAIQSRARSPALKMISPTGLWIHRSIEHYSGPTCFRCAAATLVRIRIWPRWPLWRRLPRAVTI